MPAAPCSMWLWLNLAAELAATIAAYDKSKLIRSSFDWFFMAAFWAEQSEAEQRSAASVPFKLAAGLFIALLPRCRFRLAPGCLKQPVRQSDSQTGPGDNHDGSDTKAQTALLSVFQSRVESGEWRVESEESNGSPIAVAYVVEAD